MLKNNHLCSKSPGSRASRVKKMMCRLLLSGPKEQTTPMKSHRETEACLNNTINSQTHSALKASLLSTSPKSIPEPKASSTKISHQSRPQIPFWTWKTPSINETPPELAREQYQHLMSTSQTTLTTTQHRTSPNTQTKFWVRKIKIYKKAKRNKTSMP
jgi:hypothetical protein